MAIYHLFIPNWRSATKNDLIHCHWRIKCRLKASDRAIVAHYAKEAKIPPATGKRCLSIHVVLGPRQRVCDEDAFDLSTRDACVQAGLLKDDNLKWLMPGEVVQRRAANGETPGTWLILEDVE